MPSTPAPPGQSPLAQAPMPPIQTPKKKWLLPLIVCAIVLLVVGVTTFALKKQSPSSKEVHSVNQAMNAPDYNAQTTKLATIAISYGIPKGESDCRINSVDQFYNQFNKGNEGIDYIVAPDGKSVAYVGCQMDNKKSVFANGKLTSDLDEMWRPMFSMDGKRIAFFTRKDSVWTLSLDGKETVLKVAPYGAYGKNMTFSPDGQFAYLETEYLEKDDTRKTLVIDSVKKDQYTALSLPVFGKNKSMAYRAIPLKVPGAVKEQTVFVVFNGQKGKDYQFVSNPVISPDGQRVAYIAIVKMDTKIGDTTCVIVIGKDEKPYDCSDPTMIMSLMYDKPTPIYFSEDGQTIAYPVLAERGQYTNEGVYSVIPKLSVSVNGVLGKAYASILLPLLPIVFNPSNNKVAYIVSEGARAETSFVVYDGKEGKKYATIGPYPGVPNLTFSPDGKKLIYVGVQKDTSASSDTKSTLVINDVEGKSYIAINNVTVSPDGNRVAYIAKELVPGQAHGGQESTGVTGGGIFVSRYFAVIDGKEETKYDFVRSVVGFSNDSLHTAYIAQDQNKTFVVLDSVPQNNGYDQVLTQPVFTSDGAHLAYGARKGNEVWWVVIDVK